LASRCALEDHTTEASLIAQPPLAAVTHTLVGDIAYIVRIETLRSTPFIVDASTHAKLALDRTLGLQPGFIESSRGKLLRGTARLCGLSSEGINP